MARKGDKYSLEPLARRLYADGMTLDGISAQLKVSVTSLSRWKKETRDPKREQDEWDRARLRKSSRLQRLNVLFEREIKFIEDAEAGSSFGAPLDALTKLGSLVKGFEAIEAKRLADQLAAEAPVIEIDKPALFLEFLEWQAKTLKDTDPEGLKVLASNFDYLIIQYKAEQG